ncbi:MAG: acetyl-CoA carboxylase carboxyl transferase subunit beta [Verrucomicrobia bacterium 21-51-4]|nr:MAG: acetyl-CoA carboxylase carboxyl transferase subunit beta [Verrucomicrobia bacterium 21-51-4]
MALFSKPKYSTVQIKRKEIPAGLWTKCPITKELIYNKDLEQNWMVVPHSGYHFPLDAPGRIRMLIDEGTFEEFDAEMTSVDPLKFHGVASYTSKLAQYQKQTGLNDAVICGVGALEGKQISLAVMDFRFLGASMGSVVGEKITRAIERATERRLPLVIYCASGGARMYEGILSLMQMAKTSAALARLAEAGLPYIAVHTNPTMAGVLASFASLGDVIIAEPGALIGFAGRRVIKEGTQQELPEGFQTAEFLLKHGLIDQIVPRLEHRKRLSSLLRALHRG